MIAGIRITKETRSVAETLANLFARDKKLTYKSVATKAGISDALLGAIVNGQRNITPEVLVKLAVALGVTTDYLLGLDAVESLNDLKELKFQKQQLEHQVSKLLRAAADQKSGTERTKTMQKVMALEERIARMASSLERSAAGPLKIPTRSGDEDVYRPADFVGATECVVIRNGDNNIPADSVIFLEHATKPTGAYLVNSSGKLRLTKTPAPDSAVVGAASYILLPAQAYTDNQQEDK